MTKRAENASQSERSLAECMQRMLNDEISTDVCIEVGPPDGETVKFRAHKCVLISRSEVFEGMFSSGMTECSNGAEAKVRVEDIDADTFKQLLDYVYCETTSICPESAGCLMYAAKKYMFPKLVADCCSCLLENLRVDTVIEILDLSLHLDEPRLETTCLKLISANANDILTGTEILSASRLAMKAILESGTMPVKEIVLYEAAVKWAKHQLQRSRPEESPPTGLQIRGELGDLLYKIRFPVMKPTEFAEMNKGNNILNEEEKSSIYFFIFTGKMDGQLKFPTERRPSEEFCIDRTISCVSGPWHVTKLGDAINFKTDHDVLLIGIGLLTGYRSGGYETDLEILQGSNSLFKKRVSVPFTGNSDPFKISFDEPVVIGAGVVYSAKSFYHAAIGHYGMPCREKCTNEAVTFTFSKHVNSFHTTATLGQIPRFYFCVL